jgi:hypothetical protein
LKGLSAKQRIQKSTLKNDQILQRGFKQTDEWNKKVNSTPGWESQQGNRNSENNTEMLEMKNSINKNTEESRRENNRTWKQDEGNLTVIKQ